jgi:transcription factor CRZ1
MDHQSQTRGRSPSAASQQAPPGINHSPSPARPYSAAEASTSIGLGVVGLDAQQYPQADFNNQFAGNNFLNPQSADLGFDPSQPFTDQLKSDGAFNQSFLTPAANQFGDDFTIFPASSAEQLGTLNQPLFAGDGSQQLGTPDMNAMAHHSPTPPHLLKPEPHQTPSAHASPSFNAGQFSSPGHSRHASLGPEAALMQGQDWSGQQFQVHRRTPSDFSDASSIGQRSPALMGQDTFPEHLEHSPLVRPQDGLYPQELQGMGSFSISDHRNGRSPSHSPAISPRILPQSLPDMNQTNNFVLQGQHNPYMQPAESFPQLATDVSQQAMAPSMSAPTIHIEEAPAAARTGFEGKSMMDADSLTPPARGT